MRYKSLKFTFILCCILVVLQGCIIIPYSVDIQNLDEITIEKIDASSLTGMESQQIIDRFGPPISVAKKDGPPIYLPRAFKEGSDRYEAEFFLNKFTPKHIIDKHLTVYCYQQTITKGGGVVLGVPGGAANMQGNPSNTIYSLFLLIDERTRKIVDAIVEKTE